MQGRLDIWPKVARELKGRYRIFDVYEEWFSRPDGKPTHSFYVLETLDWVNVVPITSEGRIVLIRQFRPGTCEMTIEVPGGMVDSNREDPAMAALRELEEETGYVAQSVTRTASIRPNPAIIRNWLHMFVATGVQPSGHVNFDEGEDVETMEVTWEEVDEMVRSGAITHALTLTALLYARYLK